MCTHLNFALQVVRYLEQDVSAGCMPIVIISTLCCHYCLAWSLYALVKSTLFRADLIMLDKTGCVNCFFKNKYLHFSLNVYN